MIIEELKKELNIKEYRKIFSFIYKLKMDKWGKSKFLKYNYRSGNYE